jgi:hypothetical protein
LAGTVHQKRSIDAPYKDQKTEASLFPTNDAQALCS